MTNLDKIKQYYSDVDHSTFVNGHIFEVNIDKIKDITRLFAENAVYNRNNPVISHVYDGAKSIGDFFDKIRSLDGEHKIISCVEKNGIALGEPSGIRIQKLPAKEECKTVIAKGCYSGKMNITKIENGKRIIEGSHPVELGFTDYWVFHNEKVVYRQSDISPIRNSVKRPEGRDSINR